MTEKIIMIASTKGGVGKSTAALGIAFAFCNMGLRVLMVDLDLANACLDILTGVQDRVLYTLQDVAADRAEAKDAVIELSPPEQKKKKSHTPKKGRLYLLPSGIGMEDGLCEERLCDSIRACAEYLEVDRIIIDTGAGLNNGASVAASIAQTALVVTGQMPVAVRASQSTAEKLTLAGISDIRLLINSFDAKGVTGGAHRRGLFTVIDESRLPLCGVIPYDYGLMLSHEGLSQRGDTSSAAFNNIALRLCGHNVPIFTGMKRLRKLKKKICL